MQPLDLLHQQLTTCWMAAQCRAGQPVEPACLLLLLLLLL
jgi:hypothetical protein